MASAKAGASVITMGWSLLLVGLIACVVALIGAAGLSVGARRVMRTIEKAMGHNPSRNFWEFLFTLRTHDMTSLAVTMQRAESGKPAIHPMGSPEHVNWLDQIGFVPATLDPHPRDMDAQTAMGIRLGPKASRPLALAFPVYVAPMGYGVGLSDDAKIALAQAASLVGTATSGGEGPYLPEERAYAQHWILQQSRAGWAHQAAVIGLADMLEIQLGQGSEAGIGTKKQALEVSPRTKTAADGDVLVHAAPTRDLGEWIRSLRTLRPDIPIGVKIPASHHVEKDLLLLLQWSVDVITLDGSSAGSADSPAVISDHFGLSTALAIHRAHRRLRSNTKMPSGRTVTPRAPRFNSR